MPDTLVISESGSAARGDQRYRAVAASTGHGVMITSPDGDVLEPPHHWIEFTGRSAASSLGRGWLDAIHPAERDGISAKMRNDFRTAVPFRLEFRLRPHEGEYRMVAGAARNIPRGGSSVAEWVLVYTDITEKTIADADRSNALRELNDLKAAIDEHAIVAVTDARGKITYVNDKFCSISQYSREELLGEDHRIIHSQYRPKHFIRRIWETISSGRVWKGEIKNKAKDGTYYWVDTTIVPYLGSEGRPLQYVAIRADIAARKEADEKTAHALRELNDVKAALDQHAIVAITSQRGKITHVNDKFCAISQHSREELLGQDDRIINSSHDPRDFIRNIWQTIGHDGRVWKGEIKNEAKDGSFYWVDTTIVPYLRENGQPQQYIAIRAAITERKLAEEALLRAQTDLQHHAGMLEHRSSTLRETIGEPEAFSYNVSHDMRVPLRAMQSFSKLLDRDCGAQVGEKGKEYIPRINVGAARMDALIQDVLTYSRVARTELPLQPIELKKLIDEIIETYPTFQPPAATVEISGQFPSVRSIPAVLTQCFSNLLGNAVKLVPPGVVPGIRTWTEVAGAKVKLFIKDNGLGIEQESQEMIFGIFQRVSKNYEGMGIGLSIVKKGMEGMGGGGLESEFGHGSTFWLEMQTAEFTGQNTR